MLRNKAVWIHALVWVVILAVLFFTSLRGNARETAVIFLLYGALNIAIFYIHFFLVNPLLMDARRYWKALVYVLAILVISVSVKYAVALQFDEFVLKYRDQNNDVRPIGPMQYIVSASIVGLLFMMLSTAVYSVMANFRNWEKQRSLENEKLNAELAFLKSQINPHFLFNSLNNIYSLAYQKSDKTPEAILKLSEIMRYMLYESNEETVMLDDEINYLQNYIELQKLRFKENVYVDLKVSIDEHDHRIMPLLLISFLENAFKHGISTDAAKPIRITIHVHEGRLHFKAENAKSHVNKDQTKGVGLTNLRRRLQLGYPGRHTIEIIETDDYYTGELFLYL